MAEMDEVATLYIPVLPDTTQLTAQLDQLAARIRATVAQAVRDGIKDALSSE